MLGSFGQVDLWSDESETPAVKNNGHGKEHGLFGSTIHGWELVFVSNLFQVCICFLYIYVYFIYTASRLNCA